jgi:hypothetical protein
MRLFGVYFPNYGAGFPLFGAQFPSFGAGFPLIDGAFSKPSRFGMCPTKRHLLFYTTVVFGKMKIC